VGGGGRRGNLKWDKMSIKCSTKSGKSEGSMQEGKAIPYICGAKDGANTVGACAGHQQHRADPTPQSRQEEHWLN